MKKVSMIMPCYNAQRYLDDTLRSVLEQDYKNIELLVVNDASTDGTVDKLEHWQKVFSEKGRSLSIVHCRENGGPCAAINAGLAVCTGDYLCFPDSDDWLYPEYVSSFVEALEANPDYGWAMCDAEIVEEGREMVFPFQIPRTSVYRNDFFDIVSMRTRHNTWMLMARRDYFANCVGEALYDNRLTQEWPMLLPLSYYGNYLRVPKTLYRYIKHPSSITSWQKDTCNRVVERIRGLCSLAKDVITTLPLDDESAAACSKALDLTCGFRVYETYAIHQEKSQAESLKKELLLQSKQITKANPTNNSPRLQVEYAVDFLLGVASEPLLTMYENLRGQCAEGYILYGAGRMCDYVIEELIAAVGMPVAIWDENPAGRSFFGIEVTEPFGIENKKLPVLITIVSARIGNEIKQTLSQQGFASAVDAKEMLQALRGVEVEKRRRARQPQPLVSLVIPCYNGEKWLPYLLRSILGQNYDAVELVIANDASTDRTLELLNHWSAAFEKRHFSYNIVTREQNGGLCAAINTGLAVYTGEYVCFPDADDWLYPEYVSSFVEALEANPDYGWAMCDAEIIEEGQEMVFPFRVPRTSVYRNDFFDFISTRTPHNAWMLMVRRGYFECCVGDQIHDSRLTQEWSILFPLSYHGNYLRVPKALYRYIKHPGSMESWRKGAYEDVVQHTNGLRELAKTVLSSLLLESSIAALADQALDLTYDFRIYEACAIHQSAQETESLKAKLLLQTNRIVPRSSGNESAKLQVEYAIDALLDANSQSLCCLYEHFRGQCSKGYILYGAGRMCDYIIEDLIAAVGLPVAIWDANPAGRSFFGIEVVLPDFAENKRLPVVVTIGDLTVSRKLTQTLSDHGFEQVVGAQAAIDALRGYTAGKRLRAERTQPLVSLVVPCYNGEKWLPYFMRSVLGQNYDMAEVVMVNDASTDNTPDLLRDWAVAFEKRKFSYTIVTREENGGLCAAINEGLRVFSGDYVCFPDADDWLHPDYIRLLCEALEQNPDYGWARCDAQWVREDDLEQVWRVIRNPEDHDTIGSFKQFLSYRTPISAWLLMARRDYILRCIPDGQIVESRFCQEFGLGFPLAYHGDYLVVNQPLYHYIYHPGSTSNIETENDFSRALEYLDGIEHTYEQELDRLALSLEERRLAIRIKNLVYTKLRYEFYSKHERWNEQCAEEIVPALQKELCALSSRQDWTIEEIAAQMLPLIEICMDQLLGCYQPGETHTYDSFIEDLAWKKGYALYGASDAAKYLLPSLVDSFGNPLAVFDRAAGQKKRMGSWDVLEPNTQRMRDCIVIVTIKDGQTSRQVIKQLEQEGVASVYGWDDAMCILRNRYERCFYNAI